MKDGHSAIIVARRAYRAMASPRRASARRYRRVAPLVHGPARWLERFRLDVDFACSMTHSDI